jgi:hypothetical protein
VRRILLHAQSGDAQLLWLWSAAPFRGWVHSVFRRTVNLVSAEGRLVTLSARSLDDAPDTLIADVETLAGSCGTGDPAASEGDALVVGSRLRVDLAGARRWNAWLPRWPVDTTNLPVRLAAMRERLRAIEATPASVLAHTTAALIARRTAALQLALRAGDAEAARAQAIALVGLGPGLTPSGDDLLVGFFAALHVADAPAARWTTLGKDVVARVAARTNAISLAALRAAADGRVRSTVSTLLHASMHGSPASTEAALDAVLAIGSTSGADLAGGAIAGLEAHLHVTEGQAWKPRSTSRAA